MEEDPFAPSKPMMITPLSNFKTRLEDSDYMELVWENGQILTRGRRSNDSSGCSTQNPRTTPLSDLYEADYSDVLKQNTGDVSAMNLGDTQVVPEHENPSSNAMSPPRSGRVLPEEIRAKSTKEKIELVMVSKPKAVAVAEYNKNVATEVEPKTETGLPDHEVLENEKKGVESTMMVEATNGSRAMDDRVSQKNSLHPRMESVEFSPPDAQSVAMGRSLDTVGMGIEEKESADLLGWSTELCSASLSICSHGSLEDPTSSMDTESEGSSYLNSNSDEESDDVETRVSARIRKTAKRKPSEDLDDLSERRKQEQRHKVNKRLRDLRRLLPNCNKGDKASLLDDAITYMMKLQHQFQFRLISLVNSFGAPHGMLPVPPYPPVGIGFGSPPFVPPPVPGAAFPSQPSLMPLPYFPFFDPMESSSQHSSSSMQFQRSNSTSSSGASLHTTNPGTVDRPPAHLQIPGFSQVNSETQEHLNGKARK